MVEKGKLCGIPAWTGTKNLSLVGILTKMLYTSSTSSRQYLILPLIKFIERLQVAGGLVILLLGWVPPPDA